MSLAYITIGLPPTFDLGPLPVAWHGLMIAVGIIAGAWLALRYGRDRELDPDRIQVAVFVIAIAGGLGARFYYLVQTDVGALLRPGDWFGSVGYAFYGAILIGVPAVAIYLRRKDRPLAYLDALAAGFPLGMAVGRIGDVINGEHYGPRSDFFLAIQNSHPDALTPNPALAYQNGGLYEVMLAAVIFAVMWALRHRLPAPGDLTWLVLALFATGRFFGTEEPPSRDGIRRPGLWSGQRHQSRSYDT